MINRLSTLLVSSSLMLATAACSDGGASAGDFAEDLMVDFCAKAFECKAELGDDATHASTFGASASECVTKFSPTPAERAAFDASVSAGRIKFDSAAANSCSTQLNATACTTFWNDAFPASCETAIQGTVAQGGACTGVTAGDTFSDTGDCSGELDCDPATLTCMLL